MKQFAVYARVKLTHQPAWLDAFRVKYDQRYDLHVTLKQPCSITESEVPEIRQRFDEFFARLTIPGHAINVDFTELVVDGPTDDDACIMIYVAKNPALVELQRDVVDLYGEFRDYRKPELEGYEKNFRPHLTIIHNLDAETFKEARADVKDDFRCQGLIDEVVLAVVNDASIEEALNPRNLTVARL